MTSHAAPRSLRQRIMLSFAMLVTLVAAIYGCALYQSMEYTECQLIAGFLRDEAKRVEDTLNRGEIPQLAEATAIYGAAPLKSIPTDLHHVPEGYSEYTEDAHLFVWRSTWKGEPLSVKLLPNLKFGGLRSLYGLFKQVQEPSCQPNSV